MSNLLKFRRYKKKQGNLRVKHPKLIVDEYDDEFGYMGLTSAKKKGKRHNNLELVHNPRFVKGKRLDKKAYLRRKIEYDNKKMFGNIMDDYSLSSVDETNVKEYIKNKLKKK